MPRFWASWYLYIVYHNYYTVFAHPFPSPPQKHTYLPPPKLASFDVFKINALGNMQFSQEHLKTTVYAKFGDQAVCIMGDFKIENWSSLSPPPTPHATKPSIRDDPFTRKWISHVIKMAAKWGCNLRRFLLEHQPYPYIGEKWVQIPRQQFNIYLQLLTNSSRIDTLRENFQE